MQDSGWIFGGSIKAHGRRFKILAFDLRLNWRRDKIKHSFILKEFGIDGWKQSGSTAESLRQEGSRCCTSEVVGGVRIIKIRLSFGQLQSSEKDNRMWHVVWR